MAKLVPANTSPQLAERVQRWRARILHKSGSLHDWAWDQLPYGMRRGYMRQAARMAQEEAKLGMTLLVPESLMEAKDESQDRNE